MIYFNINKNIENTIICRFCPPFLMKLKIQFVHLYETSTANNGNGKLSTNANNTLNLCALKLTIILITKPAKDSKPLQKLART